MLQQKNKIIFFILLTFSFQAFSVDWENKVFFEDNEFQYWIGLSDFNSSELKSIEQARNNATNELVKYNFGFYREEIETFSHTLNKKDLFQESINKNKNVIIKNSYISEKKIIREDNKYKAYVLLKYSKKELKLEQKRISNTNKNSSLIKNFNDKKYFNFLINSNIDNASVVLIPKNSTSKSFSTISGNPINLPSGYYTLIMTKNGYKDIKKEIILSPSQLNLYIKMETDNFFYNMNIYPRTADVYIDNIKINDPLKFSYEVKNIDLDKTITVIIKNNDFFTQEIKTSLRYIKNNVLTVNLIPKTKNYSFISYPEGASVYINGEKVGTTPLLNYPMHKKEFSVNIVKKNFKMISREIASKENTNFNFTLEKK
jgi:hypothetical protein